MNRGDQVVDVETLTGHELADLLTRIADELEGRGFTISPRVVRYTVTELLLEIARLRRPVPR